MSSMPGLVKNVEVKSHAVVSSRKVAPALFAAILGVLLLYGAGFAQTAELHNAAHDSRHSAVFPCH